MLLFFAKIKRNEEYADTDGTLLWARDLKNLCKFTACNHFLFLASKGFLKAVTKYCIDLLNYVKVAMHRSIISLYWKYQSSLNRNSGCCSEKKNETRDKQEEKNSQGKTDYVCQPPTTRWWNGFYRSSQREGSTRIMVIMRLIFNASRSIIDTVDGDCC